MIALEKPARRVGNGQENPRMLAQSNKSLNVSVLADLRRMTPRPRRMNWRRPFLSSDMHADLFAATMKT